MAAKKDEQEINLNDVQAQVAAILEQARKEAAKIVEDARAASKGDMTADQKAEREAENAKGEELVEVKLFKDNDKYKEPVFVGCNGETIAIERGVRVKIKKKFADILDNSEHQDYETSRMIEKKSSEFAKSGL